MSIKELTKKFEAIKDEFVSQFSGEFAKEVKPIFDKYPLLENFAWPQYTMGFNDGEPCYFNVYEDNVYINGENDNEWNWIPTGEKTSWGSDKMELSPEDKWKNDCVDDIAELIGDVPQDILESVYGEGLVVINKDGTHSVENYEHD